MILSVSVSVGPLGRLNDRGLDNEGELNALGYTITMKEAVILVDPELLQNLGRNAHGINSEELESR